MRLQVSKSKNAESFYIIKSFRDKESRKATSKVVEKLGTRKELEEKLGTDVDLVLWGRERARELTRKEKEQSRKVLVSYSPTKQLESGVRTVYNGGYLFLQHIYHELGLDKICKEIQSRYEFEFNLDSILSRLIYGRILFPASKRATLELSKTLIEKPDFETHQIYRGLEVLCKENDSIQASLYKNSKEVTERKTKILYFDCTNFYFEIAEEDDTRKFGRSKQHQPRPLVQMGLFMDAEGMPLAFCMEDGSKNEQLTMKPLEKKILKDFGLSTFCVVTDAGLSSLANRKLNTTKTRKFITTQSVKKLKGHLRKWALDSSGWQLEGVEGVFDLSEIDEQLHSDSVDKTLARNIRDRTFYKTRMMKEKDPATKKYFEQRIIVTFSFKHRNYQRKIRQGQIERALKAITNGSSKLDKKNQNDYRRLIKKTTITPEGEVAKKTVFTIDEETIAKEETTDGFYALCTSLEDCDVSGILKVSARRWEIEESFRIMKQELKARPVHLSRKQRIQAHFLTCFIALLVFRITEKKLGLNYTCPQIIDTLKSMDFEEVRGEGYRPLYTRTEVTDALHDAFGFRTDFEIVPGKEMKRIIKQTKNR